MAVESGRLHRLLAGFGAAALGLYLIHRLGAFLLVVFAGVLFAVFLDGAASLLARKLPRALSLAIVVVLVLVLPAAFGWFAGERIGAQLGELSERVPQAIERIRSWLEGQEWARPLLEGGGPDLSQLAGTAGAVFGSLVGIVANAVVVIVIGIYASVRPRLYADAALRVVPPRRRRRAREVLEAETRALQWWIVGRLLSMAVVGVLTAVGLWLVGMPLAFTLGAIAAVLSFVPFLGPLVAVVPAVLVAVGQGSGAVLGVAVVYLAVQTIESYVLTPLIEHRTVSLPPAALVAAELGMGILAGPLGVLLATPLTIAGIVLVQKLYVEDVLGERVRALGEHET